ncbi:uncharacterized protein ARMOST_04492 [Armillaria ostoyae]|uniref:HAT C-terminal dimerisation domain-containing protein n=1 Tax=Armillaria ostoyae TaxID=47428 RepID=A0A284QXJ1_ARMOS|nr:uncharacterized protein ARMOST_04492 [Armillaria ostoyae]
MPPKPTNNRRWWRDCFEDHPHFSLKRPEASQSGKCKVICIPCLNTRIGEVMLADEQEVSNGQRQEVRTVGDIKLMLFSTDGNSAVPREWLGAHADTLLKHLRDCPRQPPAVCDRARNELESRSPVKHMRRPPMPVNMIPTHPFQLSHPTPSHPTSSFISPGLYPESTGLLSHPDIGPLISRPSSSSSSFLAPHSSLSRAPSVAPSDSVSAVGSRRSLYSLDDESLEHFPSKRARHSISRQASFMYQPPPISWSSSDQARFEERIIRLTASAGFSLSWVENPEWIAFCEDFIPAAKVPSRKVVTNRLLPTTLDAMRASVRREAAGQSVTAQCDGWSGENHHHYIAFMVTVNGKVQTVLVHDASNEQKTAAKLFERMIEVINILENEWGVRVIAFTTDASDCYAHQINLIVGDYFKADQDFLLYSPLATELITWLRSKTFLLALIREAQLRKGASMVTVIRAVITRWTAHYLAFRRLLELQPTLKLLVAEDEMLPQKEKKIAIGDANARRRANKMIGIINDPLFWKSLARIKLHLEPLAIAANITQSAFCRLDQVLLTLGSLFIHYSKSLSATDMGERYVRYALLSSIERRWGKSDQEVFIAAVVLNPFMKLTPFRLTSQTSFLTMAGLNDLFSRLYTRFFTDPLDSAELLGNIQDYMFNTGICSILPSWSATLAKQSLAENESPDPRHIYQGLGHGSGVPMPPLFRLALHLFSVCANSASCERLFSVLGNTLTKLRNRLGTKTLTSLAEMKMHIRDEHLQMAAKVRDRLKRNFGKGKDPFAPSEIPVVPDMSESGDCDAWMDGGVESEGDTDHSGSEGSPGGSFESLTEEMSRRVQEDEDTTSTADDSDDHPITQDTISISIQDLFKFESTSWIATHQRSATRSLAEELEFYELCDLDADGDVDGGLDIDIDDTLASILGQSSGPIRHFKGRGKSRCPAQHCLHIPRDAHIHDDLPILRMCRLHSISVQLWDHHSKPDMNFGLADLGLLEWWIRSFEHWKNSDIQHITFRVCYDDEYAPSDDYSVWKKLDKACAVMGSLRLLEIIVMIAEHVDPGYNITLAHGVRAIKNQLTLSAQRGIVSVSEK